MRISHPILRSVLALLSILMLSSCTSVPADMGRAKIGFLVKERGIELPPPSVQPSLGEKLTETEVIRLALAHNPDLQALFAELGFTAADLYEAGRIRNPLFSVALLDSDESGLGDQLNLSLAASFADLLTLPARKRMAVAEYAAAREEFAFAALDLARDTQIAYYDYVAAKQTATLKQHVDKVASISLELAERLFEAGNLSPKEIELERSAAAEAKLESISAQTTEFEMRGELARLLGVSPAGAWDVLSKMPIAPEVVNPIEQLLGLARENRLDFSAAKIRADYLADKLGVTNWSRWLGDLSVAYEREREADGEVLKGPALEWELPIFSLNRGELIRAEAELKSQIAQIRALALDIDHEVQTNHIRMINARKELNAYKEHLIPARTNATERAQREQNYMLIGVFELLETKQQEYEAFEGYVEAAKEYWVARSELTRAVGNSLPGDSGTSNEFIDIDALIMPSSLPMNHQMGKGAEHGAHSDHPSQSEMDDHGAHAGHMEKEPETKPDNDQHH